MAASAFKEQPQLAQPKLIAGTSVSSVAAADTPIVEMFTENSFKSRACGTELKLLRRAAARGSDQFRKEGGARAAWARDKRVARNETKNSEANSPAATGRAATPKSWEMGPPAGTLPKGHDSKWPCPSPWCICTCAFGNPSGQILSAKGPSPLGMNPTGTAARNSSTSSNTAPASACR